MHQFAYIVWDMDPAIFSVWGREIRWYGLLFALGFLISQQIMFYMYRTEGKPERDVESLTLFMIVATILGARLGHVFFYEPARFLANPLDIFKVWEGGLASHGAAIGILTALYLYVSYYINITFTKFEIKKRKRPDQSYLWVVDRIVIVVALTGALIRLGNFMNSEIVGKPTGDENGVVFAHWIENDLERLGNNGTVINKANATTFENTPPKGITYPIEVQVEFARGYSPDQVSQLMDTQIIPRLSSSNQVRRFFTVDDNPNFTYSIHTNKGIVNAHMQADGIPRHPTQLYESVTYLLIFIFLYTLWYRMKDKTPEGMLLGLFLILVFGMRFVWEFWKENQEAFEDELPLNMGQILSIPLVLVGVGLLIYSLTKGRKAPNKVIA